MESCVLHSWAFNYFFFIGYQITDFLLQKFWSAVNKIDIDN